MNLNGKQWLGIAGVVLSALMVSTAFLTDTFGANVAHTIQGTAGFLLMVLNGIATVLSAQGQQVKDVLAMPGVQKIEVNAQANQTLAAIAVDPMVDKISPTPQAQTQVEATAKGTTK